jgi:hypothetical protein
VRRSAVRLPRLLLFPILATLSCGLGEPEAEVREWTLREDLRIGSPTDPTLALSRIGGVLAAPDGGVWVLQPTDRDIRVYGPDGALIRRVGGGGQEPGRFTLPNRMGWWGSSMDTVWVADLGLRRLSLFTGTGELAATLEMPFVTHEGVYSINQPGAVLSDGSALAVAAYSPIVTEWRDFPLLRYRLAEGTVVEELARLERTGSVLIRWQERSLTTALHPISDAPLVGFGHDGGRVVIVERGTGEPALGSVSVLALGAAGDTLWSRELPYDPEPLAQAEAESLLAPRIEALRQFAQVEGSLTEAEAEQAYRASVVVPSFRPPVQTVHVGVDGRIWMSWAAAPGQPERWSVLDPDGREVATFSAPVGLDVRAAGGDFVWAVESTQGVSYLVRYRVSEAQP